jgi:hypothetical protein
MSHGTCSSTASRHGKKLLLRDNLEEEKTAGSSNNLMINQAFSVTNSNKTNGTNDEYFDMEGQEGSKGKLVRLIEGAILQNDSQNSYSVGLNIAEELAHKYHRDLKQHLKSILKFKLFE